MNRNLFSLFYRRFCTLDTKTVERAVRIQQRRIRKRERDDLSINIYLAGAATSPVVWGGLGIDYGLKEDPKNPISEKVALSTVWGIIGGVTGVFLAPVWPVAYPIAFWGWRKSNRSHNTSKEHRNVDL
jgi:hypothetical protein